MRRSVVLFVGGAMAALMLATAGIASAVGPGKPTVVSTSPADEATGVDRDANITAKFSEKMMRSTIAARIV